MNWPTPQPIETAPKDTTILLYRPDFKNWDIGFWDDDKFAKKPRPFWQSWSFRTRWCRDNPPSQWLPMIPSPAELELDGAVEKACREARDLHFD